MWGTIWVQNEYCGDIFLYRNFGIFNTNILAFFTPKILFFLCQIFNFRKQFFDKKKWCKKAKHWFKFSFFGLNYCIFQSFAEFDVWKIFFLLQNFAVGLCTGLEQYGKQIIFRIFFSDFLWFLLWFLGPLKIYCDTIFGYYFWILFLDYFWYYFSTKFYRKELSRYLLTWIFWIRAILYHQKKSCLYLQGPIGRNLLVQIKHR